MRPGWRRYRALVLGARSGAVRLGGEKGGWDALAALSGKHAASRNGALSPPTAESCRGQGCRGP